MITQQQKADQFAALHHQTELLLLANPWDRGSARLFESLGFSALATTSGGFAATLGRLDGEVTRDEALLHATEIVEATSLPVTADLENGFADDPAGVAETVTGALAAGLAGCSVEDFTRDPSAPIYELGLAVDRVAAAAETAGAGAVQLVLTARCENYLRGRTDLADTIRRLQAYQEAGADVLYAPGLSRIEDIARLVREVDRPVNVLAVPGVAPIAELAKVGVARVSVGSSVANVAFAAVVEAAAELKDHGTYKYLSRSAAGSKAARRAFST